MHSSLGNMLVNLRRGNPASADTWKRYHHLVAQGKGLNAASNAVKYVLFANTVLILIQYFLGQMSVLRDGLVQTLTNSSPNIAQTIAYVSLASWPNG